MKALCSLGLLAAAVLPAAAEPLLSFHAVVSEAGKSVTPLCVKVPIMIATECLLEIREVAAARIVRQPELPEDIRRSLSEEGMSLYIPPKRSTDIAITLLPGDARKFAAITKKMRGRQLAILMHGRPIACPFIRAPIPGDSFVIGIYDATPAEIERIVRELQKHSSGSASPTADGPHK